MKIELNSLPLPPKSINKYSFDIISNLDDIKSLESDWDTLAPALRCEPWQSYHWMEAAAYAYSPEHRFRIITIKKKGHITGIAPMVLKSCDQPLRPMQLHFIGGEELKEPNRLVARDDVSVKIMLEVLASESAYPIRLSRIPCENGMREQVEKTFKRAGWITRFMSMPYPYMDLSVNPIKKSLRNDLRRAEKKAQSYGSPTYDLISNVNPSELTHYLDTAFKIEASGWKGRNNTAIASNQSRRHFFERYALSAHRDGILRLCFLRLNGHPIAVQYAIESMQAYWLLNIGYDETYRFCSPGNILMGRSVGTALENGLVRYNLLGKEETWTKRWTKSSTDCFVMEAFKPNYHGFKAMLSDVLYLIQKRFKDYRVQLLKKKTSTKKT